MSGDFFDYKPYNVSMLADEIELQLLKNFKYKSENYSVESDFNGKRPIITIDRLSDASKEQRKKIVQITKNLIKDLRKNAAISKELEYYLSGDTSADSFFKNLKEQGLL